MKKVLLSLLSLSLLAGLATGCVTDSKEETPEESPSSVAAESTDPDAEAVTAASPKESSDPTAIVNGLSESGYWIFAVLSDVTLTEDLVVSGTFYDKDDNTADVYRKLALYAQDADRNVTANYTLTVPSITVNSPNFKIQNGTVVGDIVVNEDGFTLADTKLEGNLTFTTQAQRDSATIDEANITGTVSVTG